MTLGTSCAARGAPRRRRLGIIEVPYAREMLERLEYDTVYHEHLCYFSVTSPRSARRGRGSSIVAVDRVPVHGGSLRVFFSAAATTRTGLAPSWPTRTSSAS